MTDISHLPVPLAVLYAGLAGTILALIVATWQNKWSCRVFFLLALRLAIGWHFLFEGLHKIHSHYVGETQTNRPFSSEPYFAAAEGPLGPTMRRQFGNIDADIAARVEPNGDERQGGLPQRIKDIEPNRRVREGFPTTTDKDFAGYAPVTVQSEWDRFV